MKILTVLTGGTISCSENNGVLAPDSGNGELLLASARRAGVKAEFVTTQPYLILSENLSTKHLNALQACIAHRLDEGFDGVIVTHGSDTLPYTAAFLDLVFGALPVTVAAVAANYPLFDSRSNGLDNFKAAVDLIGAGIGGVFVPYRNTGDAFVTVHRGRDVLPQQPFEDSLFSLFNQPFGRMEGGSLVRNPRYREREREDLFGCQLNGRVLFLRPCVDAVYPPLDETIKAVLFESWHSGTLPTASKALQDFCADARRRGIPLFLTGCTDGFAYASKGAFGELGIRVLPPLSPAQAYMRLLLHPSVSAVGAPSDR